MNPFLKSDDTCALCRTAPATKTQMTTAEFMGRKIPIAAALCEKCDKRADKDDVLKAYVQRIFGGGMMHET
jgi:hypothetical protein